MTCFDVVILAVVAIGRRLSLPVFQHASRVVLEDDDDVRRRDVESLVFRWPRRVPPIRICLVDEGQALIFDYRNCFTFPRLVLEIMEHSQSRIIRARRCFIIAHVETQNLSIAVKATTLVFFFSICPLPSTSTLHRVVQLLLLCRRSRSGSPVVARCSSLFCLSRASARARVKRNRRLARAQTRLSRKKSPFSHEENGFTYLRVEKKYLALVTPQTLHIFEIAIYRTRKLIWISRELVDSDLGLEIISRKCIKSLFVLF